jgi:pimeloyl-ACP methyl ester carboxylesterase
MNQSGAIVTGAGLPRYFGEEKTMERRIFLRGGAGSSLSVLLGRSLTQVAPSQNDAQADANLAGKIPFKTSQVEVSGNTVFLRRYGKGPAVLMVHGFPRTSLMWRFLAPKLAENHTVICVDLRAYGRSGIPASTDDHFPYSKRAMAQELVDVMVKLGFPTFTLIGHDRGGRVSYRMALDYPKNVERLAVFDVIPILEAWNRSDAQFARTYWPGFCYHSSSPFQRAICSALPKQYSITPSGKVCSARTFSRSMSQPIAIRTVFMESVRNIERRQRSMLNTIVLTKKHPSESNARCCIFGQREVRSIPSIRKTEGHWESGGSGLRAR